MGKQYNAGLYVRLSVEDAVNSQKRGKPGSPSNPQIAWGGRKDCLISYSGNQYSVPSEYAGRDVAVVGLDNVLAVYHAGKQIALHRISYQKR